MKRLSFFNYLLLLSCVTIIFVVIYVTVQQTYRTGADDPQIQITSDIKSRLHDGKNINQYLNDTINISESLSPFVTLYDAKEKPLRSSGYLNEKPPQLPGGVFDFAKNYGEDRVTWQPQPGVRMAMVVVYTNTFPVSFIAAGRSLQEVEIRESKLVTIVFIGWVICVALVLLYAVLQFHQNRNA